MRSTPAQRTFAAALLTGGFLTVAMAGTSAAAVPSAHTSGGGGSDSPIWGTVVSRGDLNVRQQPTANSSLVDRLSPGSQDRVLCAVQGQSVFGNTDWFWLVGAQGWASAAFVDTGRQWVPSCQDPCPDWKDGAWDDDNWKNGDNSWNNSNRDSGWNNGDSDWSSSSAGSGSWSFSVSGSWSFSASGSTSSSWDWIPGGR
ncbi:SH3 domain-containing protein [Streptomyces sp. NBC_00038]|uniref:SH3 domain-containing protein n=1 Tax=Streptomyces sp. NBC_00038 TaxID=2903615 RepID=UPI00224D7F04|nr:SH3 domain-containing protein [Streptomyces sp. NBC_00038]MCX5559167.1 SH3 domain-containing protein [Streptomyces sp. NBC_00038]